MIIGYLDFSPARIRSAFIKRSAAWVRPASAATFSYRGLVEAERTECLRDPCTLYCLIPFYPQLVCKFQFSFPVSL